MRRSLLLLLVATRAFADNGPDDATRALGFVTLPLFDATSRAGIDGNIVHTSSAAPPVNATTVAVHAQLVDGGTGLGAYVIAQDFLDQSSTTGWGQAGALFVVPGSAFESESLRLVLHAGAETPIGNNAGLALAGGASIVGRAGDTYWRLDGGTRITGTTSRLLLDAGLGVVIAPFAVAGEVSYSPIEAIADVPQPPATRSVTAAVTMRIVLGGVQPYAAVSTTLDRDSVAGTAGIELRR